MAGITGIAAADSDQAHENPSEDGTLGAGTDSNGVNNGAAEGYSPGFCIAASNSVHSAPSYSPC